MKKDENRMLKNVIELGIKPIPNKDFTSSTIDKIRALETEKTTINYSINSLILSPVFIFILLFELFSVLKFLTVIIPSNPDTLILQIKNEISNIILNPAILTITLSFLILYSFDIYLKKKVSAKITKPNIVYN